MRILGVNALFHDPAAAVVVDGRVVAAAEEERFSVEDEHRAGVGRTVCGEGGGGGVRGVVRDEPEPDGAGTQARQGLGEEARRLAGAGLAKAVPGVVQAQFAGRARELRIVGAADRVDVLGAKSGLRKAPGDGPVGQFPGGEGHRPLAVLAAVYLAAGAGEEPQPMRYRAAPRAVPASPAAGWTHTRLGEFLVDQAERVRQPLRGERFEAAGDAAGREVRGALAAPNTGLNTAGRPMADDPRDALECFGSAPVDLLAIGPFLVRRGRMPDFAAGGRAEREAQR